MRHFVSLALLLALAVVAAYSAPITFSPKPELPSLPPLSVLLSRTPTDFTTYNSGSGSYSNSGGSRLSEPGHYAETQWNNTGSWNSSSSSGYTVAPTFFSLFAGTYSWSDWNNTLSNFDEYYTPIGSVNSTTGGGDYGWSENGLAVNVFSDYHKVKFSIGGFENSGAGNYNYSCVGANVYGIAMNVCDNPPGSYSETRTPIEDKYTMSFAKFLKLYYGNQPKPVPGGMTPEQATEIVDMASPTPTISGVTSMSLASTSAVPESASFWLLGSGLIAFVAYRRRAVA